MFIEHDPQMPWSTTGETAPWMRQSTEAHSAPVSTTVGRCCKAPLTNAIAGAPAAEKAGPGGAGAGGHGLHRPHHGRLGLQGAVAVQHPQAPQLRHRDGHAGLRVHVAVRVHVDDPRATLGVEAQVHASVAVAADGHEGGHTEVEQSRVSEVHGQAGRREGAFCPDRLACGLR